MLAMIRRGAAWSGVLHADAERAAGSGSTRLVGWLERLGWPLRTTLFVAAGVLAVFVGVSAGPSGCRSRAGPLRCPATMRSRGC